MNVREWNELVCKWMGYKLYSCKCSGTCFDFSWFDKWPNDDVINYMLPCHIRIPVALSQESPTGVLAYKVNLSHSSDVEYYRVESFCFCCKSYHFNYVAHLLIMFVFLFEFDATLVIIINLRRSGCCTLPTGSKLSTWCCLDKLWMRHVSIKQAVEIVLMYALVSDCLALLRAACEKKHEKGDPVKNDVAYAIKAVERGLVWYPVLCSVGAHMKQ